MFEDKVLVWKFSRGSKDAFSRIYTKYENYLLTLAANLLSDPNAAQDVLHDVFVNFIRSVDKFKLTGSLKAYLATCTANRARDYLRKKQRLKTVDLDRTEPPVSTVDDPVRLADRSEQLQKLRRALTMLPHEQREVIILRLQGRIKFAQIAQLQETSIRTVHSRYRYGLNKLRSLLNGEVKNETDR